MKHLVRGAVRRIGFDLVRVPHPHTLAKHLSVLLPALDVECVVDVGAMHGQYGRLLRGIGYRGRIVSFEPVPANLAVLRARAAADPAWDVRPYALGDRAGTFPLHVQPNADFSSLLPLSAYGRSFPNVSAEPVEVAVEVRRLDDVFAEAVGAAGRVFLKSDTQGYDVPVFEGARAVLDRVVGVQLELPFKPVYDGMHDVVEGLRAIRAAGYEVTGLFPVNADPTGALIEVDCVARRAV